MSNLDQIESASQPLEVTKRKVLLKLELSGDIPKQLKAVSNTIYGIGYQPQQPSENNREWRTTDDVLYAEAKKSYDAIIEVFKSEPKVYKFASTKERIWERNKFGGGLLPPVLLLENKQATPVLTKKKNRDYFQDRKAKKKVEVVKRELTLEEQTETYLDPFQAFPAKGPLNELGAEKVQVWREKLDMLMQLTPREDLEGYEIREDYVDQQARLTAQADFQQRMRAEIDRREERPTEIEQVEDVLFDVVEAIARNFDRLQKAEAKLEKKKERSAWHPATVGFPMKPLGATESESGVVTIQVSDFFFPDFMISPTGHMLGVRAPPELFELHDQERRIKLEQELRRLEAEEVEKKRPLTEKLRIAVAMARHDPAAAAKKAASDVMEKAVEWPRAVSQRLLQQSSEAIARGLTNLMQSADDPQTALENLSDSVIRSYRTILKREGGRKDENGSALKKAKKNNEPSIKDVEKIIDDQEEMERVKEELQVAMRKSSMGVQNRPMVPVEHADTVQVTLTFLLSPPPAYTMRPPPSWRRDLARAKKQVKMELQRRREQAAQVLERIEESDVVQAVKQLARGDHRTAFQRNDTDSYSLLALQRGQLDIDNTHTSSGHGLLRSASAPADGTLAAQGGKDDLLSDWSGASNEDNSELSAGSEQDQLEYHLNGANKTDKKPREQRRRRLKSQTVTPTDDGKGNDGAFARRQARLSSSQIKAAFARKQNASNQLPPPKLKGILKSTSEGRERSQSESIYSDEESYGEDGDDYDDGDEETDIGQQSGNGGSPVRAVRGLKHRRTTSPSLPMGEERNDEDANMCTPTDRRRDSRASHASFASSVRSFASQDFPPEHPLDQEEVHIEAIRNKRSFAGSVRPENMVPKAFKVKGADCL